MKHDHLEIPGRRVPMPEWPGTKAEQDELSNACGKYFEQCSCHPDYDSMGRVIAVHVCSLHQFIIEEDRCCTRLQRLVFARRLKLRWQAQEWRIAPKEGVTVGMWEYGGAIKVTKFVDTSPEDSRSDEEDMPW